MNTQALTGMNKERQKMEIDVDNLTPMMRQYYDIKKEYSDCILFYRMGDFYEMFYDDALTASKVLEITLTKRSNSNENSPPMCGVPFHSVDRYLNTLVQSGYKVAICEQTEDPKLAKGLVKREVIRIVTPGTNLDTSALEETKNNFLMGIMAVNEDYGIALVDVSTGEFLVTELVTSKSLLDEITKFEPAEIVCNENLIISGILTDEFIEKQNLTITKLERRYYEYAAAVRMIKKHFKVEVLDGLGLAGMDNAICSAGMVLAYLYETQKNDLTHIITIKPYFSNAYMMLDGSTRRNLELTETLRDKNKRGSLLWVLDKTKTAMGARLLRSFLEQPLVNKAEIEARLDAIEDFNKNIITREEIREYLNPVYDIERLLAKICYKSANPRDLLAFMNSIEFLPAIKSLLPEFSSKLLCDYNEMLDALSDIYEKIDSAIFPEAPLSVREGRIIKEGYNEEIDRLRRASTEGKTLVSELENEEKERTGIKNLKIKYNKVFGYYIEVTNSYKDMVPDDWTRKQTLTNAERYITPRLKEFENMILGAQERLVTLEYELFSGLRDEIADEIVRISKTAKAIAGIDAFISLSVVAESENFTRPQINEEGIVDIKDGRHPVVEKMMGGDGFIVNDTYLDNKNDRISIITGPNMAGKSTYMRQTAIIVLMAQIGSFVPASSANIGICDRIFTRVGASDDLASGQSTFMVEMTEVANILRNATKDSLLILDEIGRGTSTFDGLSIAWAVVEYISNPRLLGAKTLFATHYHELTELEGKLPNVNNYCIAVREDGDNIVFLRKIVKGGADKSYGIQVARLAGVPNSVIERAKELAVELDSNDILEKAKRLEVKGAGDSPSGAKEYVENKNVIEFLSETGGMPDKNEEKKLIKPNKTDENQLSFFGSSKNEDVLAELMDMRLEELSPIDALNKLYAMQKKVKSRGL